MAHSGCAHKRVPSGVGSALAGAMGTNDNETERRAVQLHVLNRRRSDLFNQSIMVDAVMDLMLTALIAHEQGTSLSRTAASMANRLPSNDADAIFDDLIAARLLKRGDTQQHISLTDLGARLMKEYVYQATHSGNFE